MGELPRFTVDPDIRRAETLPGAVYHEAAWFERQRERVFRRTWHMFPEPNVPQQAGELTPWNLLPKCLDVPLLLSRDDGLTCLSNVCTHRGAVLLERPCKANSIRCPYHGRRFALDGAMTSMPEFEGAQGFPRAEDDLPKVPLAQWDRFAFASLAPAVPFSELIAPVLDRIGFAPLSSMEYSAEHSREYVFNANWALYCDNFLEGFHIPFVHPTLNRALDFEAYEGELFDHVSLQTGIGTDGEHTFDLPKSHVDHGKHVAGYYFFLFPLTMINVYPWGLSLNVLQPLSPTRSRVAFRTYIWDGSRHDSGAGAGLDAVEYEDEAIVERAGRGVRSELYGRGRYSPRREQGVHHFHRLLQRYMFDERARQP